MEPSDGPDRAFSREIKLQGKQASQHLRVAKYYHCCTVLTCWVSKAEQNKILNIRFTLFQVTFPQGSFLNTGISVDCTLDQNYVINWKTLVVIPMYHCTSSSTEWQQELHALFLDHSHCWKCNRCSKTDFANWFFHGCEYILIRRWTHYYKIDHHKLLLEFNFHTL